MPPSNTTSSQATIAANAAFVEGGGLRLADAMAIHAAIHDLSVKAVTISTGHTFPIQISGNKCRRVDVIVDPAVRPKGRCKFMAQNTDKQSVAAQRARAGAKISHIIPLDERGRHTTAQFSSDWGMIEGDPGELKKNCAAILRLHDVAGVSPSKAAHAATARAKRKLEEAEEAEEGGRLFLEVPFDDKDEAKDLGAKWDAATKKWYVPAGTGAGPFAKWLEGVEDLD